MIPHDRRSFLRNIVLAGAAVFTARHLRAIELDAISPKYPNYVGGPYRKSWETLYAELEREGYRLTVGGFGSDFETMTWREVYEERDEDEHIEALEKLGRLGLDGERDNLDELECEDASALANYARKGGEPNNDGSPLTWAEVIAVTDSDLSDYLDEYANTDVPRSLSSLDDDCDDWYDRVGPMHTPEGKAYREVVDILQAIEDEDEGLWEAAQQCFTIIEGSAPGNDFHGVYVNSREDLGILRRILHAAGQKVNIRVG
jgi:hypothetical protein